MYEVYAQRTPEDTDYISIGTIQMTTHFMPSNFADKKLFMRHEIWEEDLKIYPEWKTGADAIIAEQSKVDHWVFPDLPYKFLDLSS